MRFGTYSLEPRGATELAPLPGNCRRSLPANPPDRGMGHESPGEELRGI